MYAYKYCRELRSALQHLVDLSDFTYARLPLSRKKRFLRFCSVWWEFKGTTCAFVSRLSPSTTRIVVSRRRSVCMMSLTVYHPPKTKTTRILQTQRGRRDPTGFEREALYLWFRAMDELPLKKTMIDFKIIERAMGAHVFNGDDGPSYTYTSKYYGVSLVAYDALQ